MSLFDNSQRRKPPKRKEAERKHHKQRLRIERAMRDNGSLGRVTAAQAALRRPELGREILLAIQMRELSGPITKYETLRDLVTTIMMEAGVDLAGVMIKFSFGPGCGTCNHVHEKDELCGWPGCDTDHEFTAGNILGITAAPTLETIQLGAAAAGVTLDPKRPF